jgi:hypothetical protein
VRWFPAPCGRRQQDHLKGAGPLSNSVRPENLALSDKSSLHRGLEEIFPSKEPQMPHQALFLRSSLAALVCAASLFSIAASAQGTDSQVQRDRAACDGVQQDREACRREAGAAKQEAQRGGLAPAGQAEQNALARCQLLQPAADRADCEARVRGAASSSSGSVMGGGVIRESVTPVPAPPPSPAR